MPTIQEDVFNTTAKPILESVLEGFNGTILTYGQTSSGKTFTMEGIHGNSELEGIIPRTIRNVFEFIREATDDCEFTVKVSMVEIYMEKIKDLIEPARNNLNIREDKLKGVYIEDLSEHYVACEEEVIALIKIGSENRTICATKMNEQSSRSHSIFVMTIHQNNLKQMVAKTGKLFLVDLAGSEKISKTGASGLTLDQAKTINKSLTTLGMVINNLTDGRSSHIPYRDSKLTRVLQESLGGNSKTTLIITCSPSIFNYNETLSTLRFGERAKRIKNKPKINKEVTVAELKIEIENLEKVVQQGNKRLLQLEQFIQRNNLKLPSENDFSFLNKDENISYDNDNLKLSDNKVNDNKNIKDLKNINKIFYENEKIYKSNSNVDNLNNLSSEFEYVFTAVDKFKLIDQDKVNLQNFLSEIKNKFEIFRQENSEIINELKEKLDLEKAAIKLLKDSKTHDIEEKISYNNDYNFNLNEDEADIIEKIKDLEADIKEEELNSFNNEKNLENRVDKVEQSKFKLAPIRADIQEIKVIQLFETIKEKLLNGIDIHYNFNDKNENTIIINSKNKNDNTAKSEDYFEKEINSIVNTNHQILSNNKNLEVNSLDLNEKDKIEFLKKTTEEVLNKERAKFENEKKKIIKNVEEKNLKIEALSKENKELKDKLIIIELKMNPDNKNFMKKIVNLEKYLEQLNLMYHQIITQKSVLKIENQIFEKKIIKLKERLNISEKENKELIEQLSIKNEKIINLSKGHRINNPPSNLIRIIKGGTNNMIQVPLIYKERTNEENENPNHPVSVDIV